MGPILDEIFIQILTRFNKTKNFFNKTFFVAEKVSKSWFACASKLQKKLQIATTPVVSWHDLS